MSDVSAELALGTVQFGLPYGLSQPATPVPAAEVAAILATAWAGGIRMLDTAAAYGDSELRLGELAHPERPFAVVTKTRPIDRDSVTAGDVAEILARFETSRRLLGMRKIDALLVHAANDLLVPGGRALFAALETLVAQGAVGRLGVSVYDPDTLRRLLDIYPLRVVQLPCNVFDQRFLADGTLAALAKAGIEIHARSVFLQGLLLRARDTVPKRLHHASDALVRFRSLAGAAGMTPHEAAMSFVAHAPGVAKLVVGVDRLDLLATNLAAFETARRAKFDASSLALADASIIDPRLWTL